MLALCGADFRPNTTMCSSTTGLVFEITGIQDELVNTIKYTQTQLFVREYSFGHLIVHKALNTQPCQFCSVRQSQRPYFFLEKPWDPGTVSIRDLTKMVEVERTQNKTNHTKSGLPWSISFSYKEDSFTVGNTNVKKELRVSLPFASKCLCLLNCTKRKSKNPASLQSCFVMCVSTEMICTSVGGGFRAAQGSRLQCGIGSRSIPSFR